MRHLLLLIKLVPLQAQNNGVTFAVCRLTVTAFTYAEEMILHLQALHSHRLAPCLASLLLPL